MRLCPLKPVAERSKQLLDFRQQISLLNLSRIFSTCSQLAHKLTEIFQTELGHQDPALMLADGGWDSRSATETLNLEAPLSQFLDVCLKCLVKKNQAAALSH